MPRILVCLSAAALVATGAAASVQPAAGLPAWPTKPIRMIVTFSPGGSSDATVRLALVLVRADRHVAWRGDRVPTDPDGPIDRPRGAVSAPTRSLA